MPVFQDLDRYLRKSSSSNIVHLPLSSSVSPTRNNSNSKDTNTRNLASDPVALTSPLLSSPPPPMTSLSGHQSAYAALKAAHDLKHSGSTAVGLDPSVYGSHPVRGGSSSSPGFNPYHGHGYVTYQQGY